MEAYRINIVGLSNKVHRFEYEIGDRFFGQYGNDLVQRGSFKVSVLIDKHETFLEARFHIRGVAELICDRSLEPFDYPIEVEKMIVFKYGDENKEMSDEIMLIHRDTVSLELGQYIYEFISLAVPMKKLHPRFNEDDSDDGKIIYRSEAENENKEEIDPRWEKLKKLK